MGKKVVKTPGEKGVKYIRRLLFQYRVQSVIASLLMAASILTVFAGIAYGGMAAYQIFLHSEAATGKVIEFEPAEPVILPALLDFLPEENKVYPVIQYETPKGIHTYRGDIRVNADEYNNLAVEVRYQPGNEDNAMLSIEVLGLGVNAGLVLLLGILTFVNAKGLILPNLKKIEACGNSFMT